MSTQNKQRNQKIVLGLASQRGNNICADCKARQPRWTSYNLGIFICQNCASIHRNIGTHITKVKSLTMDDWTNEQVETMRNMGNEKSNAIYNPNETRNPPPPNLEDTERDSEIEQYIRAKYEYKKFFDRSALVASKLGSSRSASSVAPRSSAQVPKPYGAPSTTANPSTSSHSTPPNLPHAPLNSPSRAPLNSPYVAPVNPPRGPPNPPHVAPVNPSRGAPPNAQVLPTIQPPQPSGGVWDDMNSLRSNSQNSSLPLQYQQQQPPYSQGNHPMQLPPANSAIGASVYAIGGTPSVMGLNPYPPNQVRLNPFSPELSHPPFPPPSIPLSFPTTPTINSPPFGQPSFNVPQSPTSLAPPPAYHPQPQTSMQIQNPSFMPAPPSPSFPSAPLGHSQFLPPTIPQQYISHSAQQMHSPPSPQFPYSSPPSSQPQISGHNVSGNTQFLAMTTMQMQQQAQHQQQQQQQQMQQQALEQQQQQKMQQQHLQQMQQQHQQQQLGQNYYMSSQASGVYGGYPPGGPSSQTGGQ